MAKLAQLAPAWDSSDRAQLGAAWVEQSAGGLALLTAFAGSTSHPTLSTITGGDTSTPTVNISVRRPEGGGTAEWQTFRFGLSGCAGKTITVNIDLEHKNGGAPRAAWSGPWVNTVINSHLGWTSIAGARSVAGGILTFALDGSLGDTIYCAAMPPNTGPIALAWMQDLLSTYPALVHDDMPERVAAGIGPFVLGNLPTARDEMARTIPGQPMYGVRIGDDSVGVPMYKPRICLLAGVHPGEEHGPIALRGFVDAWLTASGLATLRQTHELWVYPHIAANGAWAGYQRHEPYWALPGGSDLNRGWTLSTSNGSALAWRSLISTRHHGAGSPCVGSIDFHDVSPGGTVAWAYWRDPTREAVLDEIVAGIPGVALFESNNSDSTTKFFRDALYIDTCITAEFSDEAGALSVYTDAGAQWAGVIERWRIAGLLPEAPTPPAYDGTVAAMSVQAAISIAAGTYTAPAASYAGTVSSMTVQASIAAVAGSYTPPVAPPTYAGGVSPMSVQISLSNVAGSYLPPYVEAPWRATATPIRRRLSKGVR